MLHMLHCIHNQQTLGYEMNIVRLVKALEKSGLRVEKKVHHKFQDGSFTTLYTCRSKTRIASWFQQPHDGEKIDSVYICPIDDQDDLMSDYQSGMYWDTIKWVVKIMHKELGV